MATRVCSAVEYIWLVKGTATQQIDGKPERLVTQVGGRINRRWEPPPDPQYVAGSESGP